MMSIPFSIGKIIDIATSKAEITTLFGLSLTQFYIALGVILCVGGACNFGRIFLLRIVGERTAALLRSRLYEKTIRQDAAFFDSNRHGELISRLSNDTTVVAKSITQNVSDGLRAAVSGIAGFGMMAYVSLPLTGFMLLIVPPLGIIGMIPTGLLEINGRCAIWPICSKVVKTDPACLGRIDQSIRGTIRKCPDGTSIQRRNTRGSSIQHENPRSIQLG
jgi:ABC-type multidrug transport system fused ATPase/permease subunit